MKTTTLILLAAALCMLLPSCAGLREDPTSALPRHYAETTATDPEGALGWFVPYAAVVPPKEAAPAVAKEK